MAVFLTQSLRSAWEQLSQRLRTREGALVAALLVGSAVLRLPLMTFHGYYADLATYIRWGDIANQGLSTLYSSSTSVTGGGPGRPGGFGAFPVMAINYPPGTPYLFGAIVYLYNHLLQPVYQTSLNALVQQDGPGPFIAKIPLLLADLAMIALLYWQARKRHSIRFAFIAAASFALSPALLYNGVIWGQTDGFVALPLLVALFAVIEERYILGGVSLALAVLIKPQPVIFVPLFLLYIWRWAGREQFVRFTVAGLVTTLAVALPVLIPNFQLPDMIHNMQAASYNDNLNLSSDAFNFWWLIGRGKEAIGSTFFGLRSGLVGDALFGAVLVLCGALIWRRRDPALFALALAVALFGFFMFMAGQHERYLFLFIPLALASVILARRDQMVELIALYLAGTALCFLNMLVGVGGGYFAGGQIIPFVSLPALSAYIAANFTPLSVTLAFLHLIAFLYALSVMLAQWVGPPAPAAPSVAPLTHDSAMANRV
ncbi:MAG TPA: glycosyltransferase 87 family protein [Ktedonobacterales bacterium]